MSKLLIPKLKGVDRLTVFLSCLIIGFILRLVLLKLMQGYDTDYEIFTRWMNTSITSNPYNFYSCDTVDYPPLYICILYLTQAIHNILNIEYNTYISHVLILLPSFIADILIAVILYKLQPKSLLPALIYYFNPAVLWDGAIWGQVDSVLLLCVVSMCFCFYRQYYRCGYLVFGIGILLKWQMLIYAPVVFCVAVFEVILKGQNWLRVLNHLLCGLWSILLMFIIALGFTLTGTWETCIGALKGYDSITMNAYNLYQLLRVSGSLDQVYAGINMKNLNTYIIFLTVVVVILYYLFNRDAEERIFVSAALCIGTMFFFGLQMHERYLIPIVPLFCCIYAVTPSKTHLCFTLFFSFIAAVNISDVLIGTYDAWYPKSMYSGAYHSEGIFLAGIGVAGYLSYWYYLIYGNYLKSTY